MSDESINFRSANALLSRHYADITAKDIALGQAYALLSIAESATLAGQQGQDLRERLLGYTVVCPEANRPGVLVNHHRVFEHIGAAENALKAWAPETGRVVAVVEVPGE